MIISENTLKWAMCLYPPLLFQRIWVRKVHKDFMGVDVRINRSLFTSNLGKSIFGGTIFSAADPFYALLFGQIMQRRNFKVTVWLKSAQISYLKPGRTDLNYTILINEQMLEEMGDALKREGKFVKAYPIQIFDTNGELCATATNEVYLRNLKFIA
jgi:acyl-coenzyme A thioesterase PaaI-like protein